jgi:hypothetical protein
MILNSAGDNNPIGIIFFAGILASLIPLSGAVKSTYRAPISFWMWVALSLAILLVLFSLLSAFV